MFEKGGKTMRMKLPYGGNAFPLAARGAMLLLGSGIVLGCGADALTTGPDPRVRFASSISASPTGCGTVVVTDAQGVPHDVQTYNVSATWQVPSGTWRAIFVNVLKGSVAATTVADATQTKTSITVEDGVAKSCEYKAGERAYAILQPAGSSPVAAEADATQTIVVGP
jgi:hypothetical protein